MSQSDTLRQRAALMEELADLAARWQEAFETHADYERATVAKLREVGATWQDIGDVLGISRQAAWEQFR